MLAIAQDQETVELRSAISAEDPAAAEYLAALVAADLVETQQIAIILGEPLGVSRPQADAGYAYRGIRGKRQSVGHIGPPVLRRCPF